MSALRRPIIGETAPDIALEDADGRRWRLADRRGRHVVVVFHRHIH